MRFYHFVLIFVNQRSKQAAQNTSDFVVLSTNPGNFAKIQNDAIMADDIVYVDYTDESMLAEIMQLVSKDLSEPYSIFTYRYFLHNWPSLCICAYTKSSSGDKGEMIGTIICKADMEGESFLKGYIAMLAVSTSQRKKGIGLTMARMGIDRMIAMGCDEVALEAEATNGGALGLYEKLGFVRDAKLARYYLNGGDAFRLRLWVDQPQQEEEASNTRISINAVPS